MRKTALLLVVTAAMLAFWPGAAMSQTSQGETLDANSLPKTTYGAGIHKLLNDFDGPAAAQTFTAINSGALTSVQIQMYKQCETVGDIRVQIATVDESGLPTNDILAETTLSASEVVTEAFPGVGDLVTVRFSDPAQVEAGKKYAVVFSLESPSDICPEAPNDDPPYWFPLKDDVYSGGASASFSPNYDPYGWGLSTDRDVVFATYVTPADTDAPKVDAVSPADGKTGVARGTNLRATFSEQMDPASISKSTYRLFRCPSTTSTNCTTQVTNATVAPSEDGLSATLDPYGASPTKLGAKTKYKAVVTTGAKDAAGNALDQNSATAGNQQKAWYFTTGSM